MSSMVSIPSPPFGDITPWKQLLVCVLNEPRRKKTGFFAYALTKMQISGNREADQCLCFRYIDSTIPLQFQASSHLLWLYSLVCVGPGRKPRRPVFSQRGSNCLQQSYWVSENLGI